MKRPLPNLLAQGFQLGLRNWPCVVWAYAVNLVFALVAAVPFATGLASYLDHSLAAQKIAGTIDFSDLGELALRVRDTSFFPMALHTAGWVNLLQLLLLFVFFAGSVFIFVSAEPPRLSVILRGGVAYFWRFVRAAILAGGISAVILGILAAIRAAGLARADAVYVERQMFLFSTISAFLVLLAALLLRLWWDLVEVYVVRNAMDGEGRVHQALLPAFRLLFRHFFRTFGSFLLAGIAGVCGLALCLFLWKLLPAHRVWIAALLAQVGLFLLLASRFWQRGLEAALVLAVDPPIVVADELAAEEMGMEAITSFAEEDMPVLPAAGVLTGLSEPTLRDLVAKLRTQPLARPEAIPGSFRPSTEPEAMSAPPAAKPEIYDPSSSRLDRHETKFPLGGVPPAKEVAPANSIEEEKLTGPSQELPLPEEAPLPEKTPHSEKLPLPDEGPFPENSPHSEKTPLPKKTSLPEKTPHSDKKPLP
jgi:hypothetical protein